ncbi:hypothetical protein ABW19_dt0208050 [Dactylella cylindrospora]|nr:hypothetical protein ABW19_dt0208050 [Dactylella cylindrospora]
MLPQHHFAEPPGFGPFGSSVEQTNGYDIGYGPPGVTYDTAFGSPREDNGLPLSPMGTSHRTLGPLDAGLPASLDSNGISYFAKYGPIAASVPSKFGMESPPASLPQNSALQSLRRSAFADEVDSTESSRSRRSPPLQPDETSFGQRLLQNRLGRGKYQISSSLPRPMGLMVPDDSPFDNSEGEDLVPTALLQDVYGGDRGKEIKNRRMSRDPEEPIVGSWQRRNTNTVPNTPGEPTSTVGSPGSFRFGSLFSRSHKKEEESPISAIGHVGSPLRNPYPKHSPPFGAIGPADSGPFSSPTRPGSNLNQGQRAGPRTGTVVPNRITPERGPSQTSLPKQFNTEEDLFPIDDVTGRVSGLGLDMQPHNEGMLIKDMSNLYLSR